MIMTVKVQREPRRQLRNRTTWMSLNDGATRRECTVIDVSPGGAKIVTDAAIDVRDRFDLALMPDQPSRHECEVVWRRGRTYGVKFVQ
jgi:PilZ domain